MNLDIDVLKGNGDYTVELVAGGSYVEGFLTSDLSFSGTAQFTGSTPLPGSDMVNSITDSARGVANLFGAGFKNVKIQNIAQTVQNWSSSDPFPVNLNFVVIAYKQGDDVLTMLAPLWDLVYPQEAGVATITAPMGYTTTPLDKDPKNVVKCWVGNWFFCPSLICTNISIQYSKELSTGGSPLFANVSCQLQTPRMVTAKEARNFFLGGG